MNDRTRFTLLWTLVTALGFGLARPLADLLPQFADPGSPLDVAVDFGLLGLLAGSLQGLLLVSQPPSGLLWALATAFGFALGPLAEHFLGIADGLALYGGFALVGVWQWLVLRRAAPKSARWMWISALGVVLGAILGQILESAWLWGAVAGLVTGWGLAGMLQKEEM
jgi:hypothetical protein